MDSSLCRCLLICDDAQAQERILAALAGSHGAPACDALAVPTLHDAPEGAPPPHAVLIYAGADAQGATSAALEARAEWPAAQVALLASAGGVDDLLPVAAAHAIPVLPADGPFAGALPGLVRALTGAQPAAPVFDLLAGSREVWQAIVESSEHAIFIKDTRGRYLLVNAAGAALLGLAPADIAGRSDGDLLPASAAERLRHADDQVLHDAAPLSYETWLGDSSQRRFVHISKAPFRLRDGTLAGIIGFCHDVTDRARVREALRESEERFRRIAENAPDMIFRWSYARGFEYVSPASVDVIGYTPEEHYADPGLGYRSIHIDDVPVYESVFSDLADPEGPRRYCVIRWHHKDGHLVHVEMRLTPLFDEHGNLTAIEGIARDITQHVVARERLRELTSQLTRAHEEERRRVAHELHDEIGQSLTIAKMHVRMAEKALPEGADAADAKLASLGATIEEALQNVRALSHELRPPLLDEMGWEPALDSLCESFSARTGLPVTFGCDGAPVRLAREAELAAYRAVQEALTNIVRHAGASQATVTARPTAHTLHLIIEDDGKGFEFAALYSADRPNAGLGLLGLQERVDAVGGRLEVNSEPGRGTRLHITLPVGEGKV